MEWLPRHALLAVWVTSDVLVSACVILRSVAPAEPSAGVGDGTEAFAFGTIERTSTVRCPSLRRPVPSWSWSRLLHNGLRVGTSPRRSDVVVDVIEPAFQTSHAALVGLWLGSVDHLQHPLAHRVRIPEQHARVPVATDRGHLRRREPHLEEAAESLVPQVVEMEVLQASPPPDALPGQPEGMAEVGNTRPVLRGRVASILTARCVSTT
jgi:hypothetical protein